MKRVRASVKDRPKSAKRLRFSRMPRAVVLRRPELKAFNVNTVFSPDSIGGAASSACLSLVAQGTDDINRIGRRLAPQFLDCRWYFTGTGSAITADCVRILIFQDRTAPHSIPPLSDVLENVGVQGVYQQSHSNRFKILYDKTQDVDYVGGVGGEGPRQSNLAHAVKLRLTGMTAYDGATGSILNVAENNVFVYCIGIPTGGIQPIRTALTWESNFLFTDL